MLSLRIRSSGCGYYVASKGGPYHAARFFSTTSCIHAKHAGPRSKLPNGPARTRFAPSPTGFLHLGSLRTALFNYLLAKRTGGQFLLRVEDTDARRTVPGAEQRLYEDLRWAGLHWDEGPDLDLPGPDGPYKQSERTPLYRSHANHLLTTPHAYRCFCSAERLAELAQQRKALGLPTDYDRQCASLSSEESSDRAAAGEAHVVRLRSPASYPPFTDLVYGKVGATGAGANAGITHKHGEVAYEDPVLLKSDGTPTYHLANVVDDHAMRITHVVRATEWLPSTPKHLALYAAFGWTPPTFAHVGLLTDADGRKLSKRAMDADVKAYRDAGISPTALVNYAALLGWSHEGRGDIMTLPDMVAAFTPRFTKGNVIVSDEKLWFLQRSHAKRAIDGDPAYASEKDDMLDRLESRVRSTLPHDDYNPILCGRKLRDYLSQLLAADARNYAAPEQFLDRNTYFFRAPDPAMLCVVADTSGEYMPSAMQRLARKTVKSVEWTAAALESSMKAASMAHAQRLAGPKDGADDVQAVQKRWYKALCRYLRWALLERHDGPGLGKSMEILGADVVKERLRSAETAVHDEDVEVDD